MRNKGRIFIISAPSGCGKTTLIYKLLNARLGLIRSVSMTTRQPRRGEADKKDYCFVTPEAFNHMKEKRGFIEWAKVVNQYYGTPRRFVESNTKDGNDVLLTIDVQGALQVKRVYPDAVSIFLLPPALTTLKERLRKRSTESESEIKKRLAIANGEINMAGLYDYTIINDDVERALKKLKAIITAERCRVIHNRC